ncbi:hypothetical protein QX776_10630 [Alteromonadaceae bacterium BrNp21-10]|nr:hypothetical protein [Alteromonadaceae bacterium BrNp21-10]
MKTPIKKLSLLVFVLGWVLVGQVAKATETNTPASNNVKVAVIDLFDDSRQRPVKILLWYPANAQCEKAAICLAKNTNPQQTAVISHGAMGSAKEYNWLGYALASQGIVTVGVNHFGESWIYGPDKVDPSAALRFNLRPQDISFVLNQLSENKIDANSQGRIFDKPLNWQNVTAIGHSSGGASVLSLAGAEFDFAQAQPYCATDAAKADKSCAYLAFLKPSSQLPAPTAPFTDKRIKRVITMDPALGHVVTQKSLNNIKVPVLVIGSKRNDFLPFATHAGFYADHIRTAKRQVLDNGEGHFVYLDKCVHAYDALGVPLCKDAEGVDRDGVHKGLYPVIFGFIYSTAN